MKRRIRIVAVATSSLAALALAGTAPPAQGATPAQAEVPNVGYAILGDTPAMGAFSVYSNTTQNNQVQVSADQGGTPGQLLLITDQPAGRFLVLNMPSTPAVPPNFECDYGPENINHASNKNNPRLGAEISVIGGKAQLLCFERSSTGVFSGYEVYTPNVCVTITGGPHYVIDGSTCRGDVYQFSKNKLTEIASGQAFPVHVEADSA
jgi:hypothetical protein